MVRQLQYRGRPASTGATCPSREDHGEGCCDGCRTEVEAPAFSDRETEDRSACRRRCAGPAAALFGRVPTLACDNGKEFADHRRVDSALDTDIFFARNLPRLRAMPKRTCQRAVARVRAQGREPAHDRPAVAAGGHRLALPPPARGLSHRLSGDWHRSATRRSGPLSSLSGAPPPTYSSLRLAGIAASIPRVPADLRPPPALHLLQMLGPKPHHARRTLLTVQLPTPKAFFPAFALRCAMGGSKSDSSVPIGAKCTRDRPRTGAARRLVRAHVLPRG